MAAKRNGLQEYDRIRSYISSIYLYGFLSREEFAALGINGRDEYDSCVKLLKTVLPFMHDEALWEGGKKRLQISRAYETGNERKLTNTYLLHTISDEELAGLLVMLSCLSEKPKSKKDLRREMELRGFEISESTLSRRLSALREYGYLQAEGKGDRLCPDPLDVLDDGELLALWDYVCFSCEVTYPRVAGSFLKRSIRRAAARRGLELPSDFPFLLRYHDCRNLFDEDIAYQLVHAIENRMAVTAEILGREREIWPVSLRIDTLLGRWYLLFWDEGPGMVRLSDITHLKFGGKTEEGLWLTRSARVREQFRCSGCSAKVDEAGACHVKVKLCFGEQTGLYRKFRRELRLGAIVREDGEEYYVVDIHDPGELVPMLRQYAPWLKIVPGKHGLERRLREDLERMRRQTEAE